MNILVINGPNLNMLGKRDETQYGKSSYIDLLNIIEDYGKQNKIQIECYQSNIEGEIVEKIQQSYGRYSGLIINPGAYGHYSIAIRDALEILKIPIIEVHISNIYKREDFRQKSIIAPVCSGQITGLGIYGYILALEGLKSFKN